MYEAGSSDTQSVSRPLNGSISNINNNCAVYLLHSNLKIFTNAIIALSKLGDELFLRSQRRGICLKAFNKNRSAYGVFLFEDDFFSYYDAKCLSSDTAKDCRVSMKSALSIFKSVYFVEKNLVSCTLTIDSFGRELHVDFQHTCDVSRSFDVNVMEKHKTFTSDVNKSDLCNAVTVSALEIAEFLNEMHTGYEELMMRAEKDKFIFKNFVQFSVGSKIARIRFRGTAAVCRRVVETNYHRNEGSACRTEVTVQRACFKKFSVRKTTEISFCMKEFKAILAFARQHACDISMFFDKPGRPLIVAVESDAGYSAEFIIATMDGDEQSDEESPGMTQEPSRLLETSAQEREVVQSMQMQENPRQENSQNEDSVCSRPLNKHVRDDTLRTGEVLDETKLEDEAVTAIDFTEEQALGDHMLVDDFVLGNGLVTEVAVDPVMEEAPVVSSERPTTVKKTVNVQFQHRFLGINHGTQHESQMAGNPFVGATQLPPS